VPVEVDLLAHELAEVVQVLRGARVLDLAGDVELVVVRQPREDLHGERQVLLRVHVAGHADLLARCALAEAPARGIRAVVDHVHRRLHALLAEDALDHVLDPGVHAHERVDAGPVDPAEAAVEELVAAQEHDVPRAGERLRVAGGPAVHDDVRVGERHLRPVETELVPARLDRLAEVRHPGVVPGRDERDPHARSNTTNAEGRALVGTGAS
jgi:hypothetical protein